MTKSREQLAAEQAEFWNGPGGKMWLAAYARIERGILGFGAAALDAAAVRPGEQVLDIGCGTGGTTAELARAVGTTGWVMGVDISEPLIGAARAQGLANATFEIGDAASWPFEDGSFDLVFSRFGVMFFGDPVAAFGNIRRPEARRALHHYRLCGGRWYGQDPDPVAAPHRSGCDQARSAGGWIPIGRGRQCSDERQ